MTVTTEEIQSLVLEIGSETTRAGYSGDDCPQAILPTILASNGTVGLSSPSLEYLKPVSLTGRGDSDAIEAIMASIFNRLCVSPKEFPLLYIDSPLQLEAIERSRQQVLELVFEHFEIPAVYFGKSSVMSMFSMGRHTGLVLECGASGSSVVPVYEGIPLASGSAASSVGGLFLDNQCDRLLQSLDAYHHLIQPAEIISGKKAVGLGESPDYSAKNIQMTDTFRHLSRQSVIRDFKESVVQIAESAAVSEKDLALRPPRYYEFPCGFNKNFGAERFQLGEHLFAGGEGGNPGITDLIKESLNKMAEKTDGHMHPQYHNHITSTLVVSGGCSLTSGFMERLNIDLQTKLPLLGKMRIQAAASPMERKLSSWLGGSILASLGTMQAFWLTKAEYMEQGPVILSKKFP